MYADMGQEAPTNNPYTIVYDYDAAGNLIYQGWSKAGTPTSAPAWAIRRSTWTQFPTSPPTWATVRTDWANGTSSQSNVWDNRKTLVYA